MTGKALHEIAHPDCVHATELGVRSIYYLLEFSSWRTNTRKREESRERGKRGGDERKINFTVS